MGLVGPIRVYISLVMEADVEGFFMVNSLSPYFLYLNTKGVEDVGTKALTASL